MASPTSNGRLHVDGRDGRYDRQELISWWRQDRLATATVLVVGAGALGNELLKNLALLGIGTVVVVDLDRVENSNLSRCVLFSEADEGEYKARVAARAAGRLNPDVEVIPVIGDVRAIGLGAFSDFDLVLGGLDNREARVFVNQACWKAGVPFVDGAIEGLMGVMRSFVPPEGACYECTMSDRDRELLAARRACSLLTREEMLEGRVPTTATSAGVVAALQVQEAVKLLHRDLLDYRFAGRGFVFNGLIHDSYAVTYPYVDGCLAHDSYEPGDRRTISGDPTFGELLEAGERELGVGTVLELEHDVVLEMSCTDCGTHEEVRRPLYTLKVGDGLCPACGARRAFEPVHALRAGDDELLSLRPPELGLAVDDVITARNGMKRRFFMLGGPETALDRLRAAA